jgi:hypothetical protein
MKTRLHSRWLLLASLVAGWTAWVHTPARADEPASILQGVMQAKAESAQGQSGPIVQTSCSSCGAGLFGGSSGWTGSCGSCGTGGCGSCGSCFPGQMCEPCVGEGCVGNTLARLHNCVCCPDPCYEPRWVAAANAAFFQDSARPVNQTRIRWDHGTNVIFPDRNTYLFADNANRRGGLEYDEARLSMEAGTEKFSITVDTPYRYWESDVASKAGFGDIAIATKSLLLDCELIQLAFQFRTTIPTASAGQGLGIGLVSLEPSLLFTVKLLEDTYFQSQIAEWVPLGGDDTAGSLLHYHFSLNQVLWRAPCCQDMLFVGTFEVNCYSFQAGKFHNELGTPVNSSGTTYAYVGPGLRYQLCDRMDFGFAAEFAVSKDHFADQLYRTEFRWRF